jgi:spore maturation protein CgeB
MAVDLHMRGNRAMNIFVFGSSITSCYWNGAATYYRGIYKQLHARGHHITFAEPDAYGRQLKRDPGDYSYVESIVYETESELQHLIRRACHSDLVIKHSGVGVFDELLEEAVLDCRTGMTRVAFWDVDAPATLDRVHADPADPFLELIPKYDVIFTYGGGDPVVRAYEGLRARVCVPIYNALDPDTHYPVKREPRFAADLAFLGNRLPDRERRVEEFFLNTAVRLPDRHFLLGGAGWGDKPKASNIRYLDHVYTRDHNAFNCTPRAVLNVSRESMAQYGFSPATRVFEAAGAAACVITDAWEGIEIFFEPDEEILVARDGSEVVEHMLRLNAGRADSIGRAAYRRAIAEHTYAHRAATVDGVLEGRVTRAGVASE